MLLMLLCSLTASAQDVIVRKNGSTVICRILEVGQTEIVYKRWTELNGNNYVMDIAGIASIHYENGKKREFGTSAGFPSVSAGARNGAIDDGSLMNMAEKSLNLAKARQLKKIGWIGGSLLMAGGVTCLVLGIIGTDEYNSYGYYDYGGYYETTMSPGLIAAGAIMAAGGITLASVCTIKANKLKNHTPFIIQSIPLVEKNILTGKNSSLAASFNSFQTSTQKTPGFGLGLTCKF